MVAHVDAGGLDTCCASPAACPHQTANITSREQPYPGCTAQFICQTLILVSLSYPSPSPPHPLPIPPLPQVLEPPSAPRRPNKVELHNDIRVDDYYW